MHRPDGWAAPILDGIAVRAHARGLAVKTVWTDVLRFWAACDPREAIGLSHDLTAFYALVNPRP